MDWNTLEAALSECPLVPILNVPRIEDSGPLASALAAGGITICEVTLRTDVGLSAIEAFKSAEPSMITGGGSVLDATALQDVLEAGADFIDSPGLDEDLLGAINHCPVPVLPRTGCARSLLLANDHSLARLDPVEPDHVSAHLGQRHACQGRRDECRALHDTHAFKDLDHGASFTGRAYEKRRAPSALARTVRHILRFAASTILPSTVITPVPAAWASA